MVKIARSSVVRRYEVNKKKAIEKIIIKIFITNEKKMKVLQSKNRFYCCGRCMGSEQIGIFIFALFLLIGTSILFFVFE
jgi:hypothetical protein